MSSAVPKTVSAALAEALAKDSNREGRVYLCIGPHCWGKAAEPGKAIANAKKNRVKIYEGARGWGFVLLDAQADAYVDDMGGICYLPKEGVEPYREVARYNMPKPKEAAK